MDKKRLVDATSTPKRRNPSGMIVYLVMPNRGRQRDRPEDSQIEPCAGLGCSQILAQECRQTSQHLQLDPGIGGVSLKPEHIRGIP
jgi:hypothetical protein